MKNVLRVLVVTIVAALLATGITAPSLADEVGPRPPTVHRKITKAEAERLVAAIKQIQQIKQA